MHEILAGKAAPESSGLEQNPAEMMPVARVKTSALLMGAREIVLEHDGQDYRLRVTASGKLILTK